MQSLLRACVACLALVAAGGVARADFTVTAILDGASQVPPNASPGTGAATFVYTTATDSLSYNVSFSGLTSPATVSHIHFGLPGINGPVILPFTAPGPLPVTSGSFSGTLTSADLIPSPGNGINTFADAITAIQNGQTYINLHTSGLPGGEIRGQIVPEPASLALAFIGLGSLFGVQAARRQRTA